MIGRPFVDRAVLNLPNGKRFTIVADGLSDANRYVGQVLLNGKPLTRSFIRHAEIEAGGELRFVMQATPNKRWATRKARPPLFDDAIREALDAFSASLRKGGRKFRKFRENDMKRGPTRKNDTIGIADTEKERWRAIGTIAEHDAVGKCAFSLAQPSG